MVKRVVLYADGASAGNPGPAAIGAVVRDEQGRVTTRISWSIGRATSNQAEYRAVIAALEEAVRLGAEQVDIRLDSELVVRQVNGRYRVKAQALKPLHHRVRRLLGRFGGFTITHIPRQQNGEAHRLAHAPLRRPET